MRRNGKTTRVVDRLIQDYFEFGAFVAVDHPYHSSRAEYLAIGPSLERSKEIFHMVARRLAAEHNILIKITDAKISSGRVNYYRTDFPKATENRDINDY